MTLGSSSPSDSAILRGRASGYSIAGALKCCDEMSKVRVRIAVIGSVLRAVGAAQPGAESSVALVWPLSPPHSHPPALATRSARSYHRLAGRYPPARSAFCRWRPRLCRTRHTGATRQAWRPPRLRTAARGRSTLVDSAPRFGWFREPRDINSRAARRPSNIVRRPALVRAATRSPARSRAAALSRRSPRPGRTRAQGTACTP